MTWIKTITPEEDDRVRLVAEAQVALFPIECAGPVHPTPPG